MFKKLSLTIAVLFIFTALFTGCFKNKVKLDYIKTPYEMTIQSYDNKDKMQEIHSKLSDMKKKGASREEQDKVMQEIGKLVSESTLEVKDKDFIDKVINEVVKLEGIKQGSIIKVPTDKMMYLIKFPYLRNETNNNAGNVIYTNQINIFSDGTALIQSYDKNSLSEAVYVKITLDEETIKYITDYYISNK